MRKHLKDWILWSLDFRYYFAFSTKSVAENVEPIKLCHSFPVQILDRTHNCGFFLSQNA